MEKREIFNKMPGLILAIAVGIIAYFISQFHKAADALVVGLLLGMVIRSLAGERHLFLPGLLFAPRFFIPLGIILYGVNLKFHKLAAIPSIAWLQLVVGVIAVFAVTVYVGGMLKVRGKTSLLIAAGTAICGASAIAIVSPVVEGKSEDTSLALIIITVFGLIGMTLYPLVQNWFSLSETAYALLTATTLHMTGLVKTAALALGKSCLALALSIKMARTTMIIPLVAILSLVVSSHGAKEKRSKVFIPWFMWVFVLVGLLFSFVRRLTPYTGIIKPYAGVFFAIALTSIGLTVNVKGLLSQLRKPLVVGLLAWFAAIVIFVMGNFLIGY